MRSMTGFGVGEASGPSGRLVAEARSVNHRFLDVRVRVPRELGEHQLFVEQVVRSRMTRGRVDVTVHAEGAAGAVGLDRARALAALRDFQAVADAFGAGERASLGLLAMVPEVFVPAAGREPEAARGALRAAVEGALDALEAMRSREGEALGADLRGRLEAAAGHADAVRSRAEGMVERLRSRLRERVERLVAGAGLDETRLAQEVALLADRADVAEELTRLACHRAELARLFEATEPVGRRVDFLLQEMAREANTIASKSSEGEVAVAVVALKAELERMREQAQNVE